MYIISAAMDIDVEKGQTGLQSSSVEARNEAGVESVSPWPLPHEHEPPNSRVFRVLQRVENALSTFNLEKRGIQRVEPHETQPLTRKSYFQTFILWVSINLAPINITLGMLGPAVFSLSFKDAALCAVFGSIAGNLPVAYIATWGPVSGNRSLVGLLPLLFL